MKNLLRNYGMVFVLIGLCLMFSLLTLKKQVPESGQAVTELVEQITDQANHEDLILTVGAFNRIIKGRDTLSNYYFMDVIDSLSPPEDQKDLLKS